MRTLGWIIIIVLVIGGIVGAAAIGDSNQQQSSTQIERPSPKYKCTITASQVTAVMLSYVKVTNENTGEAYYAFYNELPWTFNFAPGDVLSFAVTAKGGYQLNAWIFDDGTFSNANPLSLKPRGTFSMDARMMPLT